MTDILWQEGKDTTPKTSMHRYRRTAVSLLQKYWSVNKIDPKDMIMHLAQTMVTENATQFFNSGFGFVNTVGMLMCV